MKKQRYRERSGREEEKKMEAQRKKKFRSRSQCSDTMLNMEDNLIDRLNIDIYT